MLKHFKPIVPGGQLSAGELNRLQRAVENHDRGSFGGGGPPINRMLGQFLVGDNGLPPIWVKITSGTQPYAWTQQYRAGLTWADYPGGVSGTTSVLPAYEINGNAAVPAGTIAQAFYDEGHQVWLFFYLAAGGIPGSDVFVKVDASDTTTGYLSSKLVVGTNLVKTILNPGANEQIKLDAAASLTINNLTILDLLFLGVTLSTTFVFGTGFPSPKVVYTGSGETVTGTDLPAAPASGETQFCWVYNQGSGALIYDHTTILVPSQTHDYQQYPYNEVLLQWVPDGAGSGKWAVAWPQICYSVGGSFVGQEWGHNVTGTGGIAVTATDNPAAQQVDYVIDGSGVGGTTSASGQSVATDPVALTSGYADIVSVVLPHAGTYLIWYDVTGELQGAASPNSWAGYAQCQLNNTTTSTAVSSTERLIVDDPVADSTVHRQSTGFSCRVVVTGGDTIALQARWVKVAGTTANPTLANVRSNATYGRTVLGYVQLA